MAQPTLSDVLQDVGANIDQDITLPSGTELQVRSRYAHVSQEDWADFYDWKELKITYPLTVINSMVSVGLPENFDRPSSPIYDYSTGLSNPTKYEFIKPEERFSKLSTDKYAYLLGNKVSGVALIINPAIASGASLVFDFQSTPSGLATISDTVTAPRGFMSKRIEYYILRSRADSRFPIAKAESEEMLQAAKEDEDTPHGGEDNKVNDYYKRSNFRIGGS